MIRILPEKQRALEIWKLAGPVVAGMVSQTLMNVVDTAMVGRLGPVSLAAVGLGGVMSWMILGSFGAINIGAQAITARRYGEKRLEEAASILDNAIVLALIFGLVCNLIMSFVMRDLFVLFSNDTAVIEEGRKYVFIRLQGGIPLMIIMAHRGYFNGIGLTKLHMQVSIFINIANLVLNYILIFGNLGFPEMGTEGAAWASTIGTFMGMFVFIIIGIKYNKIYNLTSYRISNISLDRIKRIFRLAILSGAHTFLIMLGFNLFMGLVARLGTVEMATSNVCMSILSLSYLPGFGIGVAAATIIGQKLGEKNPDLAEIYGWEAARVGMMFMGIVGIIFFIFPSRILGVFTTDVNVIQMGVLPLRIIALVQIFDAVGMVLSQALEGAGFNKWVLYAEVIVNWGVFLPLTFIFIKIFNWGLPGAWIGLLLYMVVFGTAMVIKFSGGAWKNVEV